MSTTAIERKFSIASIISIVSAVLSFNFGAILGLVFAVIAILAGIVGVALALAPKTRGGVTSFFALALGAIGVVAAIVKVFL